MILLKNIILSALLICPYISFGQWAEISNIDQQRIETLNFLDDNLGYTFMKIETTNAESIMKTTDGGNNWTDINLPTPSGEIKDINFYTEGQGVVLIRDTSDDSVPNRLYHTADDGENWEDISPQTTASGLGIGQCQFLNENIGFFATERSLYSTINGGEDWTIDVFDEYILSIDFLDADHGVMGTWDGTFNYFGGMLTTADGGLNWTNNLLVDYSTSIGKVKQITNNIAIAAPIQGWSAVQAGKFYKTTDNGLIWNIVETPIPADDYTLRQIDFTDEMNGVVCLGNAEMTKIFQTSDGGQTWMEEATILFTADMLLQLTPNNGYIGGKTGSLYKRSMSSPIKELSTEVAIELYPSPLISGQTLNWKSTENFTHLSIIDQMGKTIYQQDVNQEQARLPTLPAGFYFVQLRNDSFFTSKKMVVN